MQGFSKHWETLSYKQQKEYLVQHPKSKYKVTKKPDIKAKLSNSVAFLGKNFTRLDRQQLDKAAAYIKGNFKEIKSAIKRSLSDHLLRLRSVGISKEDNKKLSTMLTPVLDTLKSDKSKGRKEAIKKLTSIIALGLAKASIATVAIGAAAVVGVPVALSVYMLFEYKNEIATMLDKLPVAKQVPTLLEQAIYGASKNADDVDKVTKAFVAEKVEETATETANLVAVLPSNITDLLKYFCKLEKRDLQVEYTKAVSSSIPLIRLRNALSFYDTLDTLIDTLGSIKARLQNEDTTSYLARCSAMLDKANSIRSDIFNLVVTSNTRSTDEYEEDMQAFSTSLSNYYDTQLYCGIIVLNAGTPITALHREFTNIKTDTGMLPYLGIYLSSNDESKLIAITRVPKTLPKRFFAYTNKSIKTTPAMCKRVLKDFGIL